MQTRPGRGTVTGRQQVALVLLVVAAVWVLVNGPVEGPTLVVLSATHGITVADLASVALGLVAVFLFWTGRRK